MSRAREPDPMRECGPSGRCPECNPAPVYCQTCLTVKVEDPREPCEACEKAIEEERTMEVSS
jgi:hypothetical protein